MNALARGAGVDPRLAVLVAAPREESAVAVRGARVPSAEGGARRVGPVPGWDVRRGLGSRGLGSRAVVARRASAGGLHRGDRPRARDPLVVDVVAEGIVRVPTPGVQRAGGGERRAVARPGEDGLGRGVPRSGTDGVAVGKGEDGRRGHVPVERAPVVRDGRFGKAELAVLAAAPLRSWTEGGWSGGRRGSGRSV